MKKLSFDVAMVLASVVLSGCATEVANDSSANAVGAPGAATAVRPPTLDGMSCWAGSLGGLDYVAWLFGKTTLSTGSALADTGPAAPPLTYSVKRVAAGYDVTISGKTYAVSSARDSLVGNGITMRCSPPAPLAGLTCSQGQLGSLGYATWSFDRTEVTFSSALTDTSSSPTMKYTAEESARGYDVTVNGTAFVVSSDLTSLTGPNVDMSCEKR